MDKNSVERLRFDRRLARRNGWLSEPDRDAFLETLADVSEKMTTCASEEKAPDEPAPAATAGDFSTSTSTSTTFGGFGGDSSSN